MKIKDSYNIKGKNYEKTTISLIVSSLMMSAIAGTPIHDKFDPRIKGQSFGGLAADNKVNHTHFVRFTDMLPAGTYEFKHGLNGLRIDSEWFAEKMIQN